MHNARLGPIKTYAFSLVELSIVLVILGLLTGGILAGQSLIKAAELRKVSTTLTGYQTAMRTFQDKYLALPGDMANAKSFWTTCTDTGVELCNGDGDGSIEEMDPTFKGENLRAYQHLALAGLISGTYTGIRTGGTNVADIGVNVPQGPYASSHYNYGSIVSALGPSGHNKILLTGKISSNTFVATVPVEDAWNLDTKMDDGNPRQGKFHGDHGYSCGTFACPTVCWVGTEYNLGVSTQTCRIVLGI